MKINLMEADNFTKFMKENPHLFLHPNLTTDDRDTLASIFLYKENLLNEIKELEDELAEVQFEIEQIGVSENENKNQPKLRQISLGKKKFNMDPKKGMEFLIENNLVENNPEAIAQFFFNGEGLNKTAIGDYLGEKIDFNMIVLKKFVDLHDFKTKTIVEALRDFLWSFRLPGEAQKIDRMMDCFSQRFCECNPGVFANAESCYVVSFAIIMLNTNLHNPNVKDKQTLDVFLKMCKEASKNEIQESMLKDCYSSIKKEPFKIPLDEGNDFMLTFLNPIREGWLWKQGGRYKTWKRRWFILNDGCLYYFELTADKEPRGIIPLENVNVREVDDKTKQFCFEIYSTTNDKIKACKHDSEGKVIEVGNHAVYRMSAINGEDKNEWIKKIRDCISENPLMNTTNNKRKVLAK
ncbi:cytohesin-1 isoform X2 [Brachionus plicatilis]|uniref:Cytohesin-1 isoform X2 n=1 Tax=Brachionus plicatilis TaxID=10195 RepID=A0A3M7SWS0_BRAPC|nr:cytohesin-1 isoform X2 [Brachionus plicatilis]